MVRRQMVASRSHERGRAAPGEAGERLGILPRLRTATRTLHERVELAVGLEPRLRSRSAYAALLVRFFGFYEPLEELLGVAFREGDRGWNFAARRKTPWLVQDLISLGYDAASRSSLPRCEQLPRVGNLPRAWGCAYVLEGATLGGQVIRRSLQQQTNEVGGDACAFFGAYGDRVGEMWSQFGTALTDYSNRHPHADPEIVSAAAETFASLEVWLAGEAAC